MLVFEVQDVKYPVLEFGGLRAWGTKVQGDLEFLQIIWCNIQKGIEQKHEIAMNKV